MVVRVKVKLEVKECSISTSALANSGFETEEPEVVLPLRVAERLNLYPKLPSGVVIEEYIGIGGTRVQVFRITRILKVYVICKDKIKGPIIATAVIVPNEDEVILSDKTLDALGIILIKPGEGLWRFTDDSPNVIRKSELRETW